MITKSGWSTSPEVARGRIHDAPSARTASEVPDLRQALPAVRPNTSDRRLANIVNNLFKGTEGADRIGDGTTMDAIRNERRTGRPTGGKFHAVKGRESRRGLQNWLRRNPDAPEADRVAAERLIDDLNDALGDS